MKLTNEQLTKLVHGAIYNVKKENDYMLYYRCNQEQINHLEKVDKFLYDRTFFHASVTIEFDTDATSFSFKYKVLSVGSLDSFDVYVDGIPCQFLTLEDDGEKVVEVMLPEGDKRVVIYLPCDSEAGIKEFVINGNFKEVSKRKETVLCYGDSITHGYGSLKSSITYINVCGRRLDWEIVNQGIGGYWFDEEYICPIGDSNPDKILVSLGTNQIWSNDKYDRIIKFFHRLSEVYPEIPVLVITPIWRGDKEGTDALILDMKDYLFNVCSKYSNIKLIDGYTLIPHIEYYFLDLLHPNGLGMEVYGTNLAEKIKVLNW